MYKAVFIDIDGTLLSSDHSISDLNKQVIHRLLEKNILVVLVSARPLHGMLSISQAIGATESPVVSLNGSYISLNGEIIYDSGIDTGITTNLHEQLQPFDATCIYYRQMEWYSEKDNTWTQHEQRITDVKIITEPFNTMVNDWSDNGLGPNKILVIADAPVADQAEKRLLDIYGNRLNIYKSKATYLEIMNEHASKANAIRLLMQRYGIAREEIIAIGDNYNDKEMIAFAGAGVAMGNAPDAIKAVADFVTDTNNNNGVAKAIEHFVKW